MQAMVRDPQTQEGGLARLLRGLDDAEAARRLAAFGPNRIQAGRTRGTAAIIAEAMREPTFLLLLAAVVVYLLLGDPGPGAFLLASAVATIGLVVAQEARSERALAALRKIAQPQARVVRDGAARRVAAAELVPGDIVLVMEGERLPADGVLVAGDVLSVDESALTGESVPVAKTPDPAQAGGGEAARPGEANAPWLFSGTLVVRGQGSACVTRTGPTTEIGRIGASLAGLDLEAPPLQRTTRRLVRQMGLFAIAAAAAVTVAYGLIEGDWAGGALAALTLGISMVPEEFPMVLAIFLALGAWRMAQHKVLVRRGAAIETLGAMSLLCVDKTGTLTENRMEVAVLWRDGRSWEIAAAPPPEAPARVLHVAGLASAPEPVDPMDRAVRSLVGTQADGGRRPIRSWPLRPDRLAFVQAWEELDGDVLLAAKGAPEAVFHLCRLPRAEHDRLEAVVAQFAMRGLRVLAVASARRTADGHLEPEQVRFSFEGLVGFADPVRADVPPALASARHAGIAVAMITGDYPATALEIARQAGLDVSGGVLSGAEIAELNRAALCERARTVRVFARISPEQKLALVEAFRANGEVVGMIGDGVNDAPALEAADVGVAMGRRGTDVAREAADLVLLDDRFASIVEGVRQGRRIFANLRAALTYIVAVHVPVAGLALLPVLLGLPPVLFPMQVVVLELVIDPMCSIVFESRAGEAGSMRRRPRPLGEPLFGRARMAVALAQGLAALAVVFGLHWALAAGGASDEASRAATIAALVAANLGLAGALAGVGRIFALTAGPAAALFAVAIWTPPVARLFQFAPPDPGVLVLALALGGGVGALSGWIGARAVR